MRGSTTPVVVDFDKFDKYHDFTFVLLAKKLLYISISTILKSNTLLFSQNFEPS
jgi:hypothetical protein